MQIITKSDQFIENKIIQAAILNKDYLSKLIFIYKSEYIQNKNAKTILSWVIDFYKKYEQSPGNNMIDIFDFRKKELKESEYELIEQMLQFLSDEEISDINYDYLFSETEKYFKIRSYKVLADELDKATQFGSTDDAENTLLKFREVQQTLSGWINPFDANEISSTFDSSESDILFSLSGAIGRVLGNFKKNTLMGVMAPPKRGKTWFMQELAYAALLKKLNVYWASLEMNPAQSKMRLYKKINPFTDSENYSLPVFDCLLNQSGECTNINRKNKIIITDSEGIMKPNSNYKPCDYCRDKKNKDFSPTVYFFTKKNQKIGYNEIKEKVNRFNKWFRPNFVFKSYPRFSVTLSQIIRDIKSNIQAGGPMPHVIVVDYFAICKPEYQNATERGRIDDTWKLGAAAAQELNCLMITGHQGNRAAIDAKQIKQTHAAEDIRVVAHCDKFVGLSQTALEKKKGIMRVTSLAERDDELAGIDTATIIGNLSIGQMIIDSEFGAIL